jgi:Predicted membrane protein (DUF2339)
MEINQNQLDQLLRKLSDLRAKQDALNKEYDDLNAVVQSFKVTAAAKTEKKEEIPDFVFTPAPEKPVVLLPTTPQAPPSDTPVWDLERYIGENLSNKVGAIITVLGVGIGIKYAIDNNLIGPLTRILLGYAVGFVLFFVSYRLRQQYRELSAVILSAGICIAYYTTYAANIYYQLIPESIAFALMLGITVVTVWQALDYDLQVIAIGGLVGAYAIPFLLSDGTERPMLLFSYMALVNCAILYISFWRDWKMMHVTYILTWCIFFPWAFNVSQTPLVLSGLLFATLFFGIFTAIYFAEKWVRNTAHIFEDSFYLFANGLLYGAAGLALVSHLDGSTPFYLFLFFNIFIYLIFSYLVFKRSAQEKPFGLFSRAAFFFINLYLINKFQGPLLTALCALELVVLFSIGRKFKLVAYETFFLTLASGLLLGIGLFETVPYFRYYDEFATIWNKHSISFWVAILAFVVTYIIHQNTRQQADGKVVAIEKVVPRFDLLLLVFIGLLVYLYGFNEIAHHFNLAYYNSYHSNQYPQYFEDLLSFKILWTFDFTMIFLIVLNGIVLRRVVQIADTSWQIILNLLYIASFLTLGLYELGYLKNLYFTPDFADYERTGWHLGIRYISLGLLGILCWSLQKLVHQSKTQLGTLPEILPLFFHGVALWVVSSELVHWMEWNGLGDRSYKVALSILFGCWSVILVVLGIQKQDKNYRIAGIVLFSATLLKLFFYDLVQLSTIAKTVVMVSLGALLLFISFLYNKFKARM